MKTKTELQQITVPTPESLDSFFEYLNAWIQDIIGFETIFLEIEKLETHAITQIIANQLKFDFENQSWNATTEEEKKASLEKALELFRIFIPDFKFDENDKNLNLADLLNQKIPQSEIPQDNQELPAGFPKSPETFMELFQKRDAEIIVIRNASTSQLSPCFRHPLEDFINGLVDWVKENYHNSDHKAADRYDYLVFDFLADAWATLIKDVNYSLTLVDKTCFAISVLMHKLEYSIGDIFDDDETQTLLDIFKNKSPDTKSLVLELKKKFTGWENKWVEYHALHKELSEYRGISLSNPEFLSVDDLIESFSQEFESQIKTINQEESEDPKVLNLKALITSSDDKLRALNQSVLDLFKHTNIHSKYKTFNDQVNQLYRKANPLPLEADFSSLEKDVYQKISGFYDVLHQIDVDLASQTINRFSLASFFSFFYPPSHHSIDPKKKELIDLATAYAKQLSKAITLLINLSYLQNENPIRSFNALARKAHNSLNISESFPEKSESEKDETEMIKELKTIFADWSGSTPISSKEFQPLADRVNLLKGFCQEIAKLEELAELKSTKPLEDEDTSEINIPSSPSPRSPKKEIGCQPLEATTPTLYYYSRIK